VAHRATGICQTDLHVRDQEYPVPFGRVGHEGAGRRGSGRSDRPLGQPPATTSSSAIRLAATAAPACRAAYSYCERGFEATSGRRSARRQQRFPSQRRGPRCPRALLWPVQLRPPTPSPPSAMWSGAPRRAARVARTIGCGLQTGAGAVLNSLKVACRASLAVFGSGAVRSRRHHGARSPGAHPSWQLTSTPERLRTGRRPGRQRCARPTRCRPAAEKRSPPHPGGLDFVLEITARRRCSRRPSTSWRRWGRPADRRCAAGHGSSDRHEQPSVRANRARDHPRRLHPAAVRAAADRDVPRG